MSRKNEYRFRYSKGFYRRLCEGAALNSYAKIPHQNPDVNTHYSA